jgi:hypothetical protein
MDRQPRGASPAWPEVAPDDDGDSAIVWGQDGRIYGRQISQTGTHRQPAGAVESLGDGLERPGRCATDDPATRAHDQAQSTRPAADIMTASLKEVPAGGGSLAVARQCGDLLVQPGSHQICAGSLPAADQITRGLLGRARSGPTRSHPAAATEPDAQRPARRSSRVPGRCSFDDAATSHRHPAAVRARARPNPVGPDS